MNNVLTQPSLAHTKDGRVFDPSEDVWEFHTSSRKVSLKFAPLLEWATDELVTNIKAATAGELRRIKESTVGTLMEKGIIPLLKHAYARQGTRIDHFTLGMIQAFAMSLDERHQLNLAFVKMLGHALEAHGSPTHGISHEALHWLDKQKNPGNPKGEAVLTMHPTKGPLLLGEDRVLMRALHDAWETNRIPAHAYLKILLFRLSAMRPAQVADLKCMDLTMKDGTYSLAFPQAKKPGESWRESFETWTILPEVGALLAGFIIEQKTTWAHLGMGDDLPLFVHAENLDPIRTYHYTGASLAQDLPRFLGTLMVFDPTSRTLVRLRSPRTGDAFKVNMKRFRMSLATWALLRGANLMQVAQLLGHLSIHSALQSYAGIDVEVLKDVDHKMARTEVQIAGFFKGELCDGPVSGSGIYPDSFGKAVGKCGSLCAQRKPFACYICLQFRALMSGPHEQVLQDLKAEQEQILACGGTHQADTHDMTMGAVKQVITMRDARLRQDGLTLEELLEPEGA